MIAKPKDFYTSIGLLLFAGVMYDESTHVDVGVIHAMGPLFFPRTLLYSIGLLSIILMLQSIRWGNKSPSPKYLENEHIPCGYCDIKANRINYGSIFICLFVVASLLVYIFVLPMFGYALATVAFLVLNMLVLGHRTIKFICIYIVVSAAITFGLQYIFGTLLHLFLP